MKEDRTQTRKEILARALEAKERLDELTVDKARGAARGFTDFLREQSVVGLAIGFVLGTQSQVLVSQLVTSFINPLLGLVLPGAGQLTDRTFSLSFLGQTQDFAWGALLYQIIAFTFVAIIIYMVFKGLRLDRLNKKGP